jgi:glutamate dehydrogenase (NAD(P)+)
MFTLREAAHALELDLRKCTAAIQGYGNAGHFAHSLIEEMFGTKVVAVSDSKGGIYNPNGLNAHDVEEFKKKNKTVVGFPGAQTITNEALLELDVDVLIPSALENAITGNNAGNVKAKIVAELANGPTTPDADQILHKNGVFVIPDFLCNAGGVTVSYFEQVQNAAYDRWKLDVVHERLDEHMTNAFKAVYAARQDHGTHTRLAAYTVAVRRVADACVLRGWAVKGAQKPAPKQTSVV